MAVGQAGTAYQQFLQTESEGGRGGSSGWFVFVFGRGPVAQAQTGGSGVSRRTGSAAVPRT